ncbi:unnamed protein product [Rotaria sp. Silwood1]|nr:unnamed protein product [Rotaria sp. Silwood1]
MWMPLFIELKKISLKKYINTNESDFQAAVLDLLVQLLLIRHFIYCSAEFLIMLLHDTLHSKQVIKVQDLIKHYDSLLVSGHEPEIHIDGTRDETFSATLLRILHDVILRILTNTQQLRGQINVTLASLASYYLYVLMYIMD